MTPARELDDAVITAMAERLSEAERQRLPSDPLTAEYPAMTAADAYAVQERIVADRLGGGERILGWKLGLTSAAMQAQLGVDQPDYGPILSGWFLPDAATISVSELIQPRIEAEIAFILARPLRGPGIRDRDAAAAVESVLPALEVIDSRIRDWKIRLPDTVADLASTGRVILGRGRVALDETLDLRSLNAVLERDSVAVASGSGAAVLGNPIRALAWAANALGPLGVTLEPGQVVMTGAMHASLTVGPGERYRATIDSLGSVSVTFR